jgi:hypothetical protein
MKQTIGRITLMLLVLISGAVAVTTFQLRSHQLNTADVENGLEFLLSVYVPLVAVMAGFYLGEKSLGRGRTPVEVFIFVLAVTILWVLPPPVILLFTKRPMGYLDHLIPLKVWGDSIVALAVAYYFGKEPQQ